MARILVTSAGYRGDVLPFPRPPDWPPRYELTGFIPWEPPTALLTDEVLQFLDDGPPPVLVTLGTSAATNAQKMFELMAEALDDLQVRGLFLVGDPSNITGPLRDRPGVWPFVPLHRLLPRCRAVVHSASLGTTAAVLGCGVPSVGVPLLFDQIWNAYRTKQLGAGLVLRHPAARSSRNVLHQLLTDERLGQHAGVLAARLSGERGATRAADAIDAVLEPRDDSRR